MATKNDYPTVLCARFCSSFAIVLIAAAALCGLASIPAEASPRRETTRPPTIKPPIVRPPRTGIDGARGYRAPLADVRARWAKLYGQLGKGLLVLDKKTGKWGFKGTSETFHSVLTAKKAWRVMVEVSGYLKDGDVKGAKAAWKLENYGYQYLWYKRGIGGADRGIKVRDFRYGRDKAGKARAKADETAHGNIMDQMWKGLKNAEAKGLKPVKSSSPVTN